MTDSIKPPSRPTSVAPSATQDSPAPAASEAFRASLEAAGVGAEGIGPTSPIGRVAEAVRSGDLSAQEAGVALIRELVSGSLAAGLNAAQRTELEQLLRDALEDDPGLQAWMNELGRAR